jgi:hypothetical protein
LPINIKEGLERIMNKQACGRRLLAAVAALALLLAPGGAACAETQAVDTPEAAEAAALREFGKWKEMGLICPEVEFEGSADNIVEIPERDGGERWFGRVFPHRYDVRWYIGPLDQGGPEGLEGRKYGCNLSVDADSRRLAAATIDALADADDEPVRESTIYRLSGDEAGEDEEIPLFFYDNFTDIFPAELTVERLCALLAEYWGFDGFRLAETVDGEYFDEPQAPAAPDSLLKDMNADTRDNYYLTVFFEGDQPAAPRYVQLQQFPGYVSLTVGVGHAVG